MADEAANPAPDGQGAEQVAPEVDLSRYGNTLDDGEKAFMTKLLSRKEPEPANPTVEEGEPEEGDEDPETTPPVESQTTDDPDEEDDSEPVESDAEADETDDADPLPDEFGVNDLAEAMGVKPEDLLGRIRIDTEDGPLSLDEVRKGYLRQADYTRKTQAHAEKIKADTAKVEQRSSELQQKEQFVQDALGFLAQDIASYPTDEQLLYMMDPSSEHYNPDAARIGRERDLKVKRFNRMMAEFEGRRSEAQKAQTQRVADHNKEQEKQLLQAVPDLKDATKRTAFAEGIKSYLVEGMGFTEKDVQNYFSNAWNHRHVLMIDKARKYDELQKGQKKHQKLKAVPKVQKPGAKRSEGDQSAARIQKLRDRLKRTGKDSDAAALFQARLSRRK